MYILFLFNKINYILKKKKKKKKVYIYIYKWKIIIYKIINTNNYIFI